MLHSIRVSYRLTLPRQTPIAMHLTVFVPDLLWPDIEDKAAFDFPGANDLAKVLALAKRSRRPMQSKDSWESLLTGLFGFDDHPLPLAALRALGEDRPATGPLLCADPVNLSFIQHSLVLSPIDGASLSEGDTHALLTSLNEEFAGEGHFMADTMAETRQQSASHWYFIPDHPTHTLPDLAACSRLAGHRVDADETRHMLDRDALKWLNRIQMCLNQHPVNEAREAQGLPAINSLWPWGLGQFVHPPQARYSHVSGQSALLAGLCLATQTPLSPTGDFATMAGNPPGNHLVVDVGLTQAISHDDLAAWQRDMSTLVNHWISPAMAALSKRQHALQSISLISPGATHEYTWTLGNSHKALRGGWLQRLFGHRSQTPDLHNLVRSWSA